MVEVLLSYLETIFGADGRAYQPRACGAPMPDGRWQGWIEFVPADHATLLRSPLETLQLNRLETVRWASQLTPEYLEMAMERATHRGSFVTQRDKGIESCRASRRTETGHHRYHREQ